MTPETNQEIVIPLHVEEVSVAKQSIVTGQLRISTVTQQSEVLVDELLKQERVEVERTVVNRPVDRMPAVREDGDTLIVPVVEEVLVVERRLILKEEIRLRRIQQTGRHHEYVNIRKQEAVITRTAIATEGNGNKEEGKFKEKAMAYEKIVTVYNTVDKAKEALRVLQASGFQPEEISLIDRNALGNAPTRESGLWRRIFGTNVWDHEAEVYARTVKEGGAVLSLRVPHEQVARAMSILDVHDPVDVHEKAASYGVTVPAAAKALVTPPAAAVAKAAAATTGAVGAKLDSAKDEVIRLAEEQLKVGKRLFETGTTRIRRYVVEKPVEAQVTLHEEHAEVARRAISDPSYVQDVDWTDRTIEVTETDERAVVSKQARVAEEVVVRKTGSDRVETVRDTVRRQQVDVERTPKDKETKT